MDWEMGDCRCLDLNGWIKLWELGLVSCQSLPRHMKAGGSLLCSQALCSWAVFHTNLPSSNKSRSPQSPSKHDRSPPQLFVFLSVHWNRYFVHEGTCCQHICLFQEKNLHLKIPDLLLTKNWVIKDWILLLILSSSTKITYLATQ